MIADWSIHGFQCHSSSLRYAVAQINLLDDYGSFFMQNAILIIVKSIVLQIVANEMLVKCFDEHLHCNPTMLQRMYALLCKIEFSQYTEPHIQSVLSYKMRIVEQIYIYEWRKGLLVPCLFIYKATTWRWIASSDGRRVGESNVYL